MKKLLFLSTLVTIIFATDSLAQTKWVNWAPLESNNGIELEYRFGLNTSYNGDQNTELQIKVYNTRHKEVMVNFKEIMFSNGDREWGGYLLSAKQDSYTFTFRTKGITDGFTTNWTVEYYD